MNEFLYSPLTNLDGVGPKLADKLALLIGGRELRHLLFHKPLRWVERVEVNDIEEVVENTVCTLEAEVQSFTGAARGSKVQKVRLVDETGFLTLVFFNANTAYLKSQYPVGKRVVVSGLVEDFHGQRQITHPDFVTTPEKRDSIPKIEPIYPLTAGITNRRLTGFIHQVLKDVQPVDEWLQAPLVQQKGWPAFILALQSLHAPADLDEERTEKALERLAYDEAYARAVSFSLHRSRTALNNAPEILDNQKTKDRFTQSLPYPLTGAQERAISETEADMRETSPMQRMLQGDVGSGKTTIAAFACALAASNGHQVAVMAPTEVLARQLESAIGGVLEPLGIKTACLTGGLRKSGKTKIQDDIATGALDVICGTHALFQTGVDFKSLGLVVIDEQHRFGVNDRAKLAAKGLSPHLLIMSATPIPRSLAMTIHGDVDLSILDEKPVGRQPIETRTVPDTRLDEVFSSISRAIQNGQQVFWVCPKVEEDEDGRSAIQRHAMLEDWLGQEIGLVHGRLKADEKQSALSRFREGNTRLLVATTVIEVGVDVPNATIMVIEGAEQFGLAQLHQLRGRVGRGEKKSFCILVYTPPLGETAKRRLDTLRKSEDGFYIAETDFKLRGPGDILGIEQSGLPNFHFLDLHKHSDLLLIAKKDAAVTGPSSLKETSAETKFLLKLIGPDLSNAPTA